jgi:hypothetical protein
MRSKRFTASLFSSYDGLLIFGESPISASRDARRGRSSVRLRRNLVVRHGIGEGQQSTPDAVIHLVMSSSIAVAETSSAPTGRGALDRVWAQANTKSPRVLH